MKHVKIAYWAVIVLLSMVFAFQNQEYFAGKQSLSFNLGFFAYQTPELPQALLWLAFLVVGFAVYFLYTVPKKIKLKKNIKKPERNLGLSFGRDRNA
jgi:uncharacterized integral membrane protein